MKNKTENRKPPVHSMRQLRRLHKLLLKIKRQPHATSGLCYNMDYVDGNATALPDKFLCRKLWKLWDKYSGYEAYPVPHPIHRASFAYHNTREKWDTSTEYGRNRWELLNYLIDQVEFMISFMVGDLDEDDLDDE